MSEAAENRVRAALTNEKLDHERFRGTSDDVAILDPAALGRLMRFARAVLHRRDRVDLLQTNLAYAIKTRAKQEGIVYDIESAGSLIAFAAADAASQLATMSPTNPTNHHFWTSWPIQEATRVLADLIEAPDAGLRTMLGALADVASLYFGPDPLRMLLSALGRGEAVLKDTDRAFLADSPLALRLLEFLISVGVEDIALAARAALSRSKPWRMDFEDQSLGDPGEPLAVFDLAEDVAREILAMAMDHLASVSDGRTSYRPDKAFSRLDSHTVAYCIRIASQRTAPWLGDVIRRLLAGTSIAPLPKARTAPSQAATIAIAKAIGETPIASTVAALRVVAGQVRHAGLKWKLKRLLGPAERRLTETSHFLADAAEFRQYSAASIRAVRQSIEILYKSGGELSAGLLRRLCDVSDIWPLMSGLGREPIALITAALIQAFREDPEHGGVVLVQR